MFFSFTTPPPFSRHDSWSLCFSNGNTDVGQLTKRPESRVEFLGILAKGYLPTSFRWSNWHFCLEITRFGKYGFDWEDVIDGEGTLRGFYGSGLLAASGELSIQRPSDFAACRLPGISTWSLYDQSDTPQISTCAGYRRLHESTVPHTLLLLPWFHSGFQIYHGTSFLKQRAIFLNTYSITKLGRRKRKKSK